MVYIGFWIVPEWLPRVRFTGAYFYYVLVIANVLPGRGREELTALLGPSLDSPYFARSRRDTIYLLGPERTFGFGVDSEWLLIWLDPSGRVERHRIAVD